MKKIAPLDRIKEYFMTAPEAEVVRALDIIQVIVDMRRIANGTAIVPPAKRAYKKRREIEKEPT
jgi:hypothetical protein